jgi:hypothetical protein
MRSISAGIASSRAVMPSALQVSEPSAELGAL